MSEFIAQLDLRASPLSIHVAISSVNCVSLAPTWQPSWMDAHCWLQPFVLLVDYVSVGVVGGGLYRLY